MEKTVTCKFCKKEDAEWPENYVKGCSMIETDTGTIHTRERCNNIQHPKLTPKKIEWYRYTCYKCGLVGRLNPRFFHKPGKKVECKNCTREKFIKLQEYGIEL